jgi:aspartate/methionine/tyrosine aminotransferase
LIERAELARIAEFIASRGGVLIVDEIYQGLTYGVRPWTALGLPGDVVIVNSFSKYFCMTGWRLGWTVLPPSAVRGFEKLAQHLFISAPSAAQYAACAAFSPESLSVLEERRAEFARRRDFLLPVLRRSGLAVPAEPHGAFYVYADCGGDARRYCMALLEKEAVAATPGVDFGANGTERYVRFAYTRSMADLEEAGRRITRFAASSASA